MGCLSLLRHRRSADFLSLIRVTKLEECRDHRADPKSRAKFGKEITSPLDSNNTSRKSPDCWVAEEAFARAVSVLMFGYALVSAKDPDNSLWCIIHASLQRCDKVGKFSKLDSRNGYTCQVELRAAEHATRHGRGRCMMDRSEMSLGDVVTWLANRRHPWPVVAEFPAAKRTHPGATNINC